jgi:hypothetical protein
MKMKLPHFLVNPRIWSVGRDKHASTLHTAKQKKILM